MTREEILKECERNWETSHPMHRTLLAYDRRPDDDAFKLRWNQETGYYEMNGLRDLTYEDMLEVLGAGPSVLPYFNTKSHLRARTNYENILFRNDDDGQYNMYNNPVIQIPSLGIIRIIGFGENRDLEVLNLGSSKSHVMLCGTYLHALCANCYNLKKVVGVINVGRLGVNDSSVDSLCNGADYSDSFHNCYNLEEVLLYFVRQDVWFGDSPKINYRSLKYLIDNRSTWHNTNPTIYVHPTTYSYIIGESTPPVRSEGRKHYGRNC